MRIRVVRTGQWLATEARVAQSIVERMVGLLTRAHLPEGEALIFPECRSIHTIGMRFTIDALFVDRAWQVVAIRASLGPGQLVMPVSGAWGVVEMAQGSAARAGVGVGDQLEVVA